VVASDASTVALTQLDVEFDGDRHDDSPWGEAVIDFTGVSDVLYFNLVVSGTWRIRNVPVLSRAGAGVAQSAGILFDLGVADGTDVTSVNAAWDLTTILLTEAPGGAATVGVGSRDYLIDSGTERRTIGFALPAPVLVGVEAAAALGSAQAGQKATLPNFPNQEAGKNECVPTALSNSLQWLNTTYGLGLNEADISIAAMKGVVGWTPTGANQQWWSKKRSRFKDVLLTTTIPKFNVNEIHDAVAAGCDVELRSNNHVVSVTGSVPTGGGNYSLDLTHDTVQGNNDQGTGAAGTQTVQWDAKKKQFSGAPWIEGRAADLIVKECPKRRT
jgi:hypothetical protein